MSRFLCEEGSYPLVSIVILNYNGLRMSHLPECLESVKQTKYPNLEIIVVDNASTDDSFKYVETSFPDVTIIKNAQNLGYAGGNNVGAKYASGKYVAFLNNDTKVTPNWINEIVKVFERDQKVAIAGCKILCYDAPTRIDSAGCFIDRFGYPVERGRYFGLALKDNEQYGELCEVFYVSGAALVIHREIFEEIGAFDPKFFMYYEEVDLCWRAWLHGHKVIYCPTAIVYHKRSPVLMIPDDERLLYHIYKNRFAMLLKNYGVQSLMTIEPILIFNKIMVAIGHLLLRRPRRSLALLNALLWNIRELRYILRRRQFVQNVVRKVSDKDISKMIVNRNMLLQQMLNLFWKR